MTPELVGDLGTPEILIILVTLVILFGGGLVTVLVVAGLVRARGGRVQVPTDQPVDHDH